MIQRWRAVRAVLAGVYGPGEVPEPQPEGLWLVCYDRASAPPSD